MQTVLTQSTQDYLKHIFELTEHGQAASTNDLAARLGIKPGSVTGMIQKLATIEPPLVDYQKHQGVTLTSGRRTSRVGSIASPPPVGELAGTVARLLPGMKSMRRPVAWNT